MGCHDDLPFELIIIVDVWCDVGERCAVGVVGVIRAVLCLGHRAMRAHGTAAEKRASAAPPPP